MKSFRALDLSVEFYELSENADIKGNLRDQLLRAASSKRTQNEKKRFYQMAYASTQECKTALRLAKISDPRITDTAECVTWRPRSDSVRTINRGSRIPNFMGKDSGGPIGAGKTAVGTEMDRGEDRPVSGVDLRFGPYAPPWA